MDSMHFKSVQKDKKYYLPSRTLFMKKFKLNLKFNNAKHKQTLHFFICNTKIVVFPMKTYLFLSIKSTILKVLVENE